MTALQLFFLKVKATTYKPAMLAVKTRPRTNFVQEGERGIFVQILILISCDPVNSVSIYLMVRTILPTVRYNRKRLAQDLLMSQLFTERESEAIKLFTLIT